MAMDNRRYKLKTKRAASEGGKPGGSCKVRKWARLGQKKTAPAG